MPGRFSIIDSGLLDRARELQERFERIDSDELDRIAAKLERDATANGLGPGEYLADMVEKAFVESPHNGALFYSGRCPDDPALKNRFVAQAWAERNNAARPGEQVTTLEETAGGRELDGMRLYDLGLPRLTDLGISEDGPDELWGRLSERYAEQTSGRTGVFATDMFPEAILCEEEVPSLRRNVEVGADNVEFAYPPPAALWGGQPLDPHVRDVVGQPGFQARLQFYNSTHPKNAYLDPAAANAMSKDDLQQVAQERCEDVDRYDRGEIPTPNPSPGPMPTPSPTATPAPTPTPGSTTTPAPTPTPTSGPTLAPIVVPTSDPASVPSTGVASVVSTAPPAGASVTPPAIPAPAHGTMVPADPRSGPDPAASSPDPDPGTPADPGPSAEVDPVVDRDAVGAVDSVRPLEVAGDGEITEPSGDAAGRTADDYEREQDAAVSAANGTRPREAVDIAPPSGRRELTADDYERQHDAAVRESFAGAAVDDGVGGHDGEQVNVPDRERGWAS